MTRLIHRMFSRVFDARRPAPVVRSAAHFRARLLLQALEGRVVPATFTVNTAADTGAGSLRQAITDANATADNDIINFSALFSTPQIVNLQTALPAITQGVSITGPGAANVNIRRDPALPATTAFRVFTFNMATSAVSTLSGVTVSGGLADGTTAGSRRGGGIAVGGGRSAIITDSVISGNTAGGEGGGLYVGTGSSLTLRNSTVSGNSAGTVAAAPYKTGGGVYMRSGGFLLIENSTISGNNTVNDGGGIYMFGGGTPGNWTIRNSTISGNTAGRSGGGIMMYTTSGTHPLLIQNTTIVGNSAGSTTAGEGGGGIARDGTSGTVTIDSSVIANNTNTLSADFLGTVTSNFSLIRNQTGAVITGSNNLAANTDPMLGGLAANGGPVQTHIPLTGSPLINFGANSGLAGFDARGSSFARSVGQTDIGAVEFVAAGTPTARGAFANVTSNGATSYTFQVTYADDTAIDVTTLGTGDVRVTGPGVNVLATFVSVDVNTNGPVRTATYSFTPPGGSWDAADLGTFTIGVEANQVQDTATNAIPLTPAVGGFRALTPATFNVTTDADAGAGSLRQAVLDANARTDTADVIAFDPTFFGVARTISLTTGELLIADALTVNGPGVSLLTVRRDAAATTQHRIFTINALGIRDVNLSRLTISGGLTTGAGGGGTGGDGAGILMFNENVTLTNVAMTGNTASSEGGAVAVASTNNGAGGAGNLTIRNSTISGNTANGGAGTGGYGGAGGGLYFANGGGLTIENSTISGNTSTTSTGGGIYFYGSALGGAVTIRNTTISGNTAGGSSGGLYLGTFTGTARVQNSTIVSNTAASTAAGTGGGGIGFFGTTGTLQIASSVIANNTNANGPDLLGPATVSTSLIRNQTGSVITDGGGNLAAGTDPLFVAGGLANNGGPTQTIALQGTSPLLNVGSNPGVAVTDQRGPGFARQSGAGVDIGAFEVQGAAPINVVSTVVNAGGTPDFALQRSVVTSITVTFSGSVAFPLAAATAFRLNRTAGGPAADVVLAVQDLSTPTQTIVRLTFTGGPIQGAANSLEDGIYAFTIFSAQVSGNGLALDGDANGTPGGDYLAPASVRMFRRFGDTDGDQDVDLSDLIRFGTAYQNPAGYQPYYDFDGDGDVDLSDLINFGARYQVLFP